MADSMELYYAEMEAGRNDAENKFFAARPSLDSGPEPELYRKLFRAGYERAFHRLWKERPASREGESRE